MSWQRRFRAGWPALLLVGAIACGDDAPEPTGAAMSMDPPDEGEIQPNRAPIIQSVRIEPEEPATGERVRALVNVRDPDGDSVEIGYVWTLGGRRLVSSGPEAQLGEIAKGVRLEVEVTASDGSDESEPFTTHRTIRNRRPAVTRLSLKPNPEVQSGQSVMVSAEGRDPDGDALEFEYRWTVNGRSSGEHGPSFDTDGLDRGDEIQVQVIANDGTSESDPIESGVVRVANAFPEILSDPTGNWKDGWFRYQVKARDPDGDRNLRFSLRQGPEGMTLNPVLGEVTWQPTADQAGKHPVEVAVQDAEGAESGQYFELTVRATETPPPAAPDVSADDI